MRKGKDYQTPDHAHKEFPHSLLELSLTQTVRLINIKNTIYLVSSSDGR